MRYALMHQAWLERPADDREFLLSRLARSPTSDAAFAATIPFSRVSTLFSSGHA
jgi:hypothetical protein